MKAFKEYHEERILSEAVQFLPLILTGLSQAARIGGPAVVKYGARLLKSGGKVTGSLAKGTGKVAGKTILKHPLKTGTIAGGAFVGKSIGDSIESVTEFLKEVIAEHIDEETIKALANIFHMLKLTAPAIIAVLAGGLVLKKFLEKNKNKPENIASR